MLGEFLSANVCTPFLVFMVEGVYGIVGSLVVSEKINLGFMAGDEKADVGYWTGILGWFCSPLEKRQADKL